MDLARPVKEQDEMSFFRKAEDNLMEIIARRFGFEYPFNEEIKKVDKILLNTEYRDLMSKNKLRESDFNGVDPLKQKIYPWSPLKAKSEMMERLEKLGLQVER